MLILFADGNHKLIRWKFVVHAGIDGYSRMVVFCKCSSNNRASTVLDAFLGGVRLYGLPSRVRSDQGGENTLVARHMLETRGVDRRSMITGSSVHNQRIERLWRDLFRFGSIRVYIGTQGICHAHANYLIGISHSTYPPTDQMVWCIMMLRGHSNAKVLWKPPATLGFLISFSQICTGDSLVGPMMC